MDIGIQHDTRIKKTRRKQNSAQIKLGAKKLSKKNRHKTLSSKKIGTTIFTRTSISNYHATCDNQKTVSSEYNYLVYKCICNMLRFVNMNVK